MFENPAYISELNCSESYDFWWKGGSHAGNIHIIPGCSGISPGGIKGTILSAKDKAIIKTSSLSTALSLWAPNCT